MLWLDFENIPFFVANIIYFRFIRARDKIQPWLVLVAVVMVVTIMNGLFAWR